MINVLDLRKGNVFKFEDDIWTVMTTQHITPGKGQALVKIRARSNKTGNSKEVTFRSGEKVEFIDIFERKVTYSYKDNKQFIFMDNETFEQYHVDEDLCENLEMYIMPNCELSLSLHNNDVLAVNLPTTVNLRVTHSEPGLRGDTATKATKPVEVETGYKLNVPLFINTDDIIKIDTRTGEYLERKKG